MPSNATRLQWSTTIAAPPERVWTVMFAPDTYSEWTKPFDPGSRFEGSWEQGSRIRFVSGTGDGMLSEIAEARPNQFMSVRHLGMIMNGVEDTTSDAVKNWSGAMENYTFTAVPEGTRVVVDLDVSPEWEQMMRDTWPKALAKLKEISETGRA
jgi:uncharacterized protein YndB with AHSA1/START domain